MRIGVVNNQTEQSLKLIPKLRMLCLENNLILDNKRPDVVVSIGGDGTLLSAFHRYAHMLESVRFVGIHTGHLGFYTDWREYSLEELVDSLVNDNGESISYPLLDVEVNYNDEKESLRYLALNESAIKRVDGTLVCDVYIRDEYFERFRGDGMCVSTPTGSTGYNKSLGGAVLHPRLEALQLTEIASLNNRVFRTLSSPLVIAPDEWIRLKPKETDSFIMSIDQLTSNEENVEEIRFRIAKERIHFARYKHTHFWNRVEDAFIGAKNKNED